MLEAFAPPQSPSLCMAALLELRHAAMAAV
jgi:hypothetical protein